MTVAVYFQAGADQHLFTCEIEFPEQVVGEFFNEIGQSNLEDIRIVRNVFAVRDNMHDEELEMLIYKAIEDEVNKGEKV